MAERTTPTLPIKKRIAGLVFSAVFLASGAGLFQRSLASDQPIKPDTVSSPGITESAPQSKEFNVEPCFKDRTNMADEEVRKNVETDVAFVKNAIAAIPKIGNPYICISAQKRYKYDFPAVEEDSNVIARIMTHETFVAIFINMEQGPTAEAEHVIIHEMKHYLDPVGNKAYLAKHISAEQVQKAEEKRIELMHAISNFDFLIKNKEAKKGGSSIAKETIENKFAERSPISLQDIIDAAREYAEDVVINPQEYLQFNKDTADVRELKERYEKELYAEFSAFLLRAQKEDLIKEKPCRHPVLKALTE